MAKIPTHRNISLTSNKRRSRSATMKKKVRMKWKLRRKMNSVRLHRRTSMRSTGRIRSASLSTILNSA